MKNNFGYTEKQKEMIERDIDKEERISLTYMQGISGLVCIAKKGNLKREGIPMALSHDKK